MSGKMRSTPAKYSSLPAQIDTWFKAFQKAKEMIGNSESHRKIHLAKETEYLALLYLKSNFVHGYKIPEAFGQIFCCYNFFLLHPLIVHQCHKAIFNVGLDVLYFHVIATCLLCYRP